MIQINISNKTAYLLVGLLLVIGVLGVVLAATPWVDKGVWHDAGDIKVEIGDAYYDLESVIEELKSNTGFPNNCQKLANSETTYAGSEKKIVDVPLYCKDGKTCFLIFRTSYKDGSRVDEKMRFYTQSSSDYWSYDPHDNTQATPQENGNGADVIFNSESVELYDDSTVTGGEMSPDKWTVWDGTSNYKSDGLWACPFYEFS